MAATLGFAVDLFSRTAAGDVDRHRRVFAPEARGWLRQTPSSKQIALHFLRISGLQKERDSTE